MLGKKKEKGAGVEVKLCVWSRYEVVLCVGVGCGDRDKEQF